MKTGELIKKLRKEKGLTQEQLGELVGVQKSAVAKWESGRVENIKRPKLKALADIFGVAPTVFLNTDDLQTSENRTPVNTLPVPDLSGLKKIPVLGHTACGSPIPAIREYDYLTVESTMKADFALVAEGKSMTGCGIMDGSLVLFQKTEAVDNGTVAAVTVGEATTIKKFYQYGNTVVLKPCNPEFNDQEYQGDELENIYVFGKAIGCLTKL